VFTATDVDYRVFICTELSHLHCIFAEGPCIYLLAGQCSELRAWNQSETELFSSDGWAVARVCFLHWCPIKYQGKVTQQLGFWLLASVWCPACVNIT